MLNIGGEVAGVAWSGQVWCARWVRAMMARMRSNTPSNADTPREAAARWLAGLARGLGTDEGAALRTWLATPAHREAILGEVAHWHGPEVIALLHELLPEESKRIRSRPRRSRTAVLFGAVGAASIVVAGANAMLDGRTLWSYFDGSHLTRMDIAPTTYVTGPHEKRRVELPDGSVVMLNADTRLSITYSRPWREARLEKGEASFRVAPDADWPFTVQAGKREFQSMGSRFALHTLDPGLVELTVAEGYVRVSFATPRRPKNGEERREILTYGEVNVGASQSARVYAGFQAVRSIEPGELAARLEWERN